MSNGGRVAIIAIHGVAEQKQGDTAQALAELLIANAPAGVSYAPGTRDELILKVPPVEPLHARGRMAGGVATSAMKQMKQSLASDFVRAGQTSSGGRRSLNATGNGLTPGADFTDYLLDKARQNNMPTDTYAASRIRLGRNANGNARGVDIYEMYWADLSRLSGKVPRILTELFTVLFRFSTLGRDTVQAAAAEFAGDKSWLWLSRFQTGLDWAYSRLLALLFLQMLMLALFLTPLGLLSDKADTVHAILSGVFGIAVLFGIAYFTKLKARFVIGLVAGVAIGGVSWSWASAQWFIGIAYLAVLSCIYDKWLCICAERFRMVRAVGWALWAFVLAALVVVAGFHQAETGLGMWVISSLRSIEYVLLAVLTWWVVVGLLLPVWLAFGWRASKAVGRNRYHARVSVVTGGMGLIVSLGFFLALTMAAWALLNGGVKSAVEQFCYSPVVFHRDWPADEACVYSPPGLAKADAFLQDRFENSTGTFSVIATLLLCLMAYLLSSFVPSVLSELKAVNDNFERLGRWLTGGFRQLDRMVSLVALCGVILALLVGLAFLRARYLPHVSWLSFLDVLRESAVPVQKWSGQWLKPLVYTAASATVAFSAVGGLLSRYVPWLRAPLDAVFDVDNHFREFPRRAIPRAQIFSRYVALLEHVSHEGYDRIVVVSHSQGTVISAELLRYMKERAAVSGAADPVGDLWRRIEGKVSLVTAGCPLRQLYAARFPVMYDWVLGSPPQGGMGPTAADVGVNVWVNLYATGDYVGRWLWSRGPAEDGSDVSCPQIDDGKYSPDLVVPTALPALLTERDICLGAGAHTHYFDKDNGKVAQKVASVVDALVAR